MFVIFRKANQSERAGEERKSERRPGTGSRVALEVVNRILIYSKPGRKLLKAFCCLPRSGLYFLTVTQEAAGGTFCGGWLQKPEHHLPGDAGSLGRTSCGRLG